MFERIIFVMFLTALLSGVASGMTTEEVVYFVENGINNSGGSGVKPAAYISAKDVEGLLEKAGVPVPTFSNKWAAIYTVRDVYRVNAVQADSRWKSEFGEDIIVPTPVAWYGSGSFLRSYHNGTLHHNAVVMEGVNLSVVEYDPLGKIKMKFLYQESIFKFNLSANLPVS